MNKIYAIAVTLSMFGTSVLAGDFDENTLTFEALYGPVDMSVDIDSDGVTDLALGVTGLNHTLGALSAEVRGELSYNLDADDIGIRGEYNATYTSVATLYGGAAVEYYVPDDSLTGGDWMFEPSVGFSVPITENIEAYAEVSYAWDMSNSWDSLGGTFEVGTPIAVTDIVSVTPSVSRGFDSASEDWNVNLATSIQF